MDFYLNSPTVPIRCPDCDGIGRKDRWNFCSRCAGSGHIIRYMLTYPEYYNTAGLPCGRQMFAGFFERPYCQGDC